MLRLLLVLSSKFRPFLKNGLFSSLRKIFLPAVQQVITAENELQPVESTDRV
jgi:hypothetical protein